MLEKINPNDMKSLALNLALDLDRNVVNIQEPSWSKGSKAQKKSGETRAIDIIIDRNQVKLHN